MMVFACRTRSYYFTEAEGLPPRDLPALLARGGVCGNARSGRATRQLPDRATHCRTHYPKYPTPIYPQEVAPCPRP